eukprot:27543-Chlamydomonas_euryale.AAC.2
MAAWRTYEPPLPFPQVPPQHHPTLFPAYQLWVDVVQLHDADGGRLAHVRVVVLQTALQRVAEVLCDLVDADAAHRAHRKRTDERVGILCVLRGGKGGRGEGQLGRRGRVGRGTTLKAPGQLVWAGMGRGRHPVADACWPEGA